MEAFKGLVIYGLVLITIYACVMAILMNNFKGPPSGRA